MYNYGYYNTPMQTIPNSIYFVNGIEGAKAFIVEPNKTVYLKDNDSNKMFVKVADSMGRTNMTIYEMKELPMQSNNQGDLKAFMEQIDKRLSSLEQSLQVAKKWDEVNE